MQRWEKDVIYSLTISPTSKIFKNYLQSALLGSRILDVFKTL